MQYVLNIARYKSAHKPQKFDLVHQTVFPHERVGFDLVHQTVFPHERVGFGHTTRLS